MRCALCCSAFTKIELLCSLCIPEAFFAFVCLSASTVFTWRLHITAFYQYSSLSWFTHLVLKYYHRIWDVAYTCDVWCLFLYDLKYVKLRMVSHLVMTVQEIFSKWDFAWASTDDDTGYRAYTHSRQPLLQKFTFTSAFWQL